MKKENTPYEKKDEFIRKAKPLLEELDQLSRLNGVPYFFTAAVENTAAGTKYLNRTRSALPMGVQLSDDKIVEHLKVCSGFIALPPNTLPDIEL